MFMTYGSTHVNHYEMLSSRSPCRLLGCRQPQAVGSFILYLADVKSSTDDQSAQAKSKMQSVRKMIDRAKKICTFPPSSQD